VAHVASIAICVVLGVVGVWQLLGNGGVIGWLLAAFLLLGARFLLRPRPGELRLLATCVAAIVALAAVLVAGLFVAWESSEVVVLRYQDESGAPVEARLWVVDLGDRPIVATGSRNKRVARIQAHPDVELVRGDRTECRRAVLITEAAATQEERHAAERLFQKKYGLRVYGSRLLALFFGAPAGEEHAVFRLDPCGQEPSSSGASGTPR
jgi:hypothetical protein